MTAPPGQLEPLFPAYAGVILAPQAMQIWEIPFPRIRGGDPGWRLASAAGAQLFPAYAGVILILTRALLCFMSFPRIRGGDPDKTFWAESTEYFSPHTRG